MSKIQPSQPSWNQKTTRTLWHTQTDTICLRSNCSAQHRHFPLRFAAGMMPEVVLAVGLWGKVPGAGTPGSSKYPKIMCRFQCICGTISTCLNSFSILGRSIRVYTCLHSLTCMPLYSHPPTSSPPEKMGSNCCKGTGFIPTELFMVSQGGPPNNKQVYIIPLFTTVISSWTFKPQLNQIKSQFSII